MAAIKILLVDDNKDSENFFEPLADLTNNLLQAELVQAYTFEEMKLIFDTTPYEYNAVILDGKGQKGLKSKTEDDGFLNVSRTWLQAKSREGLHIPYVIYSGYADELRKMFDTDPIYWKNKGEEKNMIGELRKQIEQSPYYQQCILFPEIYEVFELGLLSSKYKLDFVKITELISGTYIGNIEDVLRSLRPILESTLYTIYEKFDKRLLSTSCFRRDKIELAAALYFLAGSPEYSGDEIIFNSKVVIPPPIFHLAEVIRKITNNTAMHHYPETSSRFLVTSVSYALTEYILWFKKFYLKNYSN